MAEAVIPLFESELSRGTTTAVLEQCNGFSVIVTKCVCWYGFASHPRPLTVLRRTRIWNDQRQIIYETHHII
jgi:hypothetical protein